MANDAMTEAEHLQGSGSSFEEEGQGEWVRVRVLVEGTGFASAKLGYSGEPAQTEGAAARCFELEMCRTTEAVLARILSEWERCSPGAAGEAVLRVRYLVTRRGSADV